MTGSCLKLDLELDDVLEEIAVRRGRTITGVQQFSRKVEDVDKCEEKDSGDDKSEESLKKDLDVCRHWLRGKCIHEKCKFLHPPNVKGLLKDSREGKGSWTGAKGSWGGGWGGSWGGGW